MIPDNLIALAREIAAKHELDGNLVCAVIEQESNWNPWAIRFEPGFLARYIMPQYTAGSFNVSEAYARSFSWGLMQVMGQVAREQGFKGIFLSQLCDPATGIEYGCQVLAARLKNADGDATKALLAYNGGGNAAYAEEVLARVVNYRPPSAMSA